MTNGYRILHSFLPIEMMLLLCDGKSFLFGPDGDDWSKKLRVRFEFIASGYASVRCAFSILINPRNVDNISIDWCFCSEYLFRFLGVVEKTRLALEGSKGFRYLRKIPANMMNYLCDEQNSMQMPRFQDNSHFSISFFIVQIWNALKPWRLHKVLDKVIHFSCWCLS